MVPLIGRLKPFDKRWAYVLPLFLRIAFVRKSFLLHKILSRFVSFSLGKQRFSLLYLFFGINYNWLAVRMRLYHRAFYIP